ncbi:hypothetical protein GLAREA_01108 [Glarea lozoyensis ATCC 20868]|uniref:DUF1531-domain-containing protein n=1 Tax=Glarea lozoyensis (strain ATCC 20868 / MF5171) TaxID=1116229 RepID=S3DU60_GLAL2|nr:uncharacterized protein GLAREA_01108 [Glarea lozoyensis ATCC 20868]EPE29948.1 hypothetical protein GLAREA_01108 [Glarea lozoyensis ATCC 20868]
MDILNFLSTMGKRLAHNTKHSLTDLSIQNYIRLVAIVGAYLLLRPYLMKAVEKTQGMHLKKEIEGVKVTPNMIREGGKKVEGEGEVKGDDDGGWGGKARKRAKKVEKMREEKMRAKEGDEEDRDIEEFLVDGKDVRDLLVDYEEGVDGW